MLHPIEEFDRLAWFIEGFTEYYTALLNYRTQTLKPEEVLREINRLLNDYYTSPFRNMKQNEFEEKRWSDPSIQQLAYQRGMLLALHWDDKIRKKTQGEYCLDDVMRNLLHSIQQTQTPLSQKLIEDAVVKYLDFEEVQMDICHYIIEGETLPIPHSIFDDLYILEWIEKPDSPLSCSKENPLVIPRYVN